MNILLTLFIYQFYQLATLSLRLLRTLVNTKYLSKKKHRPPPKTTLWFHCNGAGELYALELVVQQCCKTFPSIHIIITANTPLGLKAAQEQFPSLTVQKAPSNNIFSALHFLFMYRPTLFFCFDITFPGNTILMAKLFGCALFSLDTPIVHLSLTKKRHRWYYRTMLQQFDHIFIEDKTPLISLTLSPSKIVITPNIKTASLARKKHLIPHYQKKEKGNVVLLVGSIHKNELQQYLSLFTSLKAETNPIHMILVPRVFSWEDNLLSQCAQLTDKISYWPSTHSTSINTIASHIKEAIETCDISLVCRMGILCSLYQFADIFYLGGTFNSIGGHNVLEPAMWGLPIICGPTLAPANSDAHSLKNEGGLIQAATSAELKILTKKFLHSPRARQNYGTKNYQWIRRKKQGSKQTIQSIMQYAHQHIQTRTSTIFPSYTTKVPSSTQQTPANSSLKKPSQKNQRETTNTQQ